jgi:hypothetical protein
MTAAIALRAAETELFVAGERARSGGNAEESKFEIRLSFNDRHDAQY